MTYRLYEMGASGNCYKARLLLTQLGLSWQRIPVDILKGESRSREFLALNPNGRVPLLLLPDGRPLAESNAMLCHLAEGTRFWPVDPYERALTWQWLFFEQYSHEPYIATNRFWISLLRDPEGYAEQIARNHPRGEAALAVMEQHLSERAFFVGERYGIADIALYAYTHVADEGGYDLAAYPAITAWLRRVAAQPGHIPIDA